MKAQAARCRSVAPTAGSPGTAAGCFAYCPFPRLFAEDVTGASRISVFCVSCQNRRNVFMKRFMLHLVSIPVPRTPRVLQSGSGDNRLSAIPFCVMGVRNRRAKPVRALSVTLRPHLGFGSRDRSGASFRRNTSGSNCQFGARSLFDSEYSYACCRLVRRGRS